MATGGVQREVLASLALVMLTANGLMAAVLLRAVEGHGERQAALLARGLVEQGRAPLGELAEDGLAWSFYGRGHAAFDGGGDADLAAIAREARKQGRALSWSGRPWQATLFAVPREGGESVAALRLEPVVPVWALVALMAADALVFVAAGATMLRRRLVGPLQELAGTVHAMGEGELHLRAPVEGVAEVEQLGRAFNDMGAALERRTRQLEKAVVDLRATNADLRRAREGLDRAERLAAVGSLAAGVAHEVGNPMGAVLAFLDLARREAEAGGLGERGVELIAKASREGDRVRTILRQLLDFSRPPTASIRPFDLRPVAERAIDLVRAQSPYRNVRFELVGAMPAAPVLGDEGVVTQILLNLVLNAAQAAVASGGTQVRVGVAACALARRAGDDDTSEAVARACLDAVACRVEDDGPGIPLEARERVFDPFYTTKPPGEGTGLGLANALRLAEELGGALEVGASEQLGGACLTLVLPSAGDGTGSEGARGDAGSAARALS